MVTLPTRRLAIDHSNAIWIHVDHLCWCWLLRWIEHICIYVGRGKKASKILKNREWESISGDILELEFPRWTTYKLCYRRTNFSIRHGHLHFHISCPLHLYLWQHQNKNVIKICVIVYRVKWCRTDGRRRWQAKEIENLLFVVETCNNLLQSAACSTQLSEEKKI